VDVLPGYVDLLGEVTLAETIEISGEP